MSGTTKHLFAIEEERYIRGRRMYLSPRKSTDSGELSLRSLRYSRRSRRDRK